MQAYAESSNCREAREFHGIQGITVDCVNCDWFRRVTDITVTHSSTLTLRHSLTLSAPYHGAPAAAGAEL